MTQLLSAEDNKAAYTAYHDTILEKRLHSPYAIRRHAHETQYQAFVDLIPAGATVVDSGCGEGALSVMLAKKGCIVTGIDLSEPNIAAAKDYARSQGLGDAITFLVGDAEHLPVPDKSFDYAVSSHVLEHVPDFTKGAAELARVARKQVVIAIPTCLNLSAMALLGGDNYWTPSRRSLWGVPLGLARVVVELLRGEDGVNEGYAGHKELIHIWRFPWRGKRSIEAGGLKVMRYRASSYIFPYLPFLVPFSTFLLAFRWLPIFRNFGYGTTYVCQPIQASYTSSNQ